MVDMPSMNPSPTAPMNIQVSGRHMDLGDAFRGRVADALTAAMGKYFDRGGSGEVRVSRDGHSICVDIVLLLASGQQLVSRAGGGDAHAAFDAALAKIDKRIRRYHRALTNHHPHNGGARSPAEGAPLPASLDDDDDDNDEWGSDGSAGPGGPRAAIIAETGAPLKTLTVAMAAMELSLAQAPVLLFHSLAHGGVCAVYRRPDGNIGWIDPERASASTSVKPAASNLVTNGGSATLRDRTKV